MIVKLGTREHKVLFLREQDLDVLKAAKLALNDLATLPLNESVSTDDCLSWLEYQRGVENKYAGFSSTTYKGEGINKSMELLRTGSLFKAKYDALMGKKAKARIGGKTYYYSVNGVIYLLHSDNTVNNPMFTEMPGDLSASIYRAVMTVVGNFDFYHKDSKQLVNTVKQRGYVDAGFILSKVVA